MEAQVLQDHKVYKDQPELQETLALLALTVLMEIRVLQDRKGCKDQLIDLARGYPVVRLVEDRLRYLFCKRLAGACPHAGDAHL